MSNEVTFDPLLRVNLVRDAHLHPPFSSGDGSAALRYSDTFGEIDQNVTSDVLSLYSAHPEVVVTEKYRVSHLVADLGWFDLDLGSSHGWWAATVATYCPFQIKVNSTHGRDLMGHTVQ